MFSAEHWTVIIWPDLCLFQHALSNLIGSRTKFGGFSFFGTIYNISSPLHLDVFLGRIIFELTVNRCELLLHILHHIRLHVRDQLNASGKDVRGVCLLLVDAGC
jgi:hypothetical protein